MTSKTNKKILLVSLPSQPEHVGWKRFNVTSNALKIATRPPMGIGYLAQALEDAALDYDVIDMRLGYLYDDLKVKIDSSKPTDIAFSMMTPIYKLNYELINRVKSEFPSMTVIMGGPHLTTYKEEVFTDCSIDIGFISESEHTIVKYMEGTPLGELDGIIYRDGEEVVMKDKLSFADDINVFNWPRYKKFELDKYLFHQIPLFTSRGCPYRCIFCSVENNLRKSFRGRSALSVVDEMEYWIKAGYSDLTLEDDNFTFDKERVYEICNELDKRGLNKSAVFHLDQGVRADKIDKDVFLKLRSVGFNSVAIAVEAGNDKVLRALKKGEKIETIKQTISDACETGFEVRLLFVVGAPGETWEDVQDSLKVASMYPVLSAKFCNLVPFPGTELFDYVVENKLLEREPEDYLNDFDTSFAKPLYRSETLTIEERERAFTISEEINKRLFVNYLINKSFSSAFIRAVLRPLATFFISSSLMSYIVKHKNTRKFAFYIRNKLASKGAAG